MRLGKSKIESMCRAAGCLPVKRATVMGREVFVADGFSATPHVTFQRFDIDDGDFPFGCFGTFWWTFEGDEKMAMGRPLFFDAFHDTGYSKESKQMMRVSKALKDAEETFVLRKKAAN